MKNKWKIIALAYILELVGFVWISLIVNWKIGLAVYLLICGNALQCSLETKQQLRKLGYDV